MSTRKLIALIVLAAIPLTMVILPSIPPETAWAVFFDELGMSRTEQTLWGAGMTIMCTFSFTGVAAVGCGLAALG